MCGFSILSLGRWPFHILTHDVIDKHFWGAVSWAIMAIALTEGTLLLLFSVGRVFSHFPAQRSCLSLSQNVSSRKDLKLLRYKGCRLLLELPPCWNDEILKVEFQVGEWGDFEGKEFLLWMSLTPYRSLTQACPSTYSLRIRISTHFIVQTPLYTLEQTRVPY